MHYFPCKQFILYTKDIKFGFCCFGKDTKVDYMMHTHTIHIYRIIESMEQ